MLYDVAIPQLPLGTLTYESPVTLPSRIRVIVPVQNHLRAGFILGRSDSSPEFDVKAIEGVIDDAPVIPRDIWDMSLWAGRVCFCGAGASLKAVLPRAVIEGEKIEAPPDVNALCVRGAMTERDYFNPFDSERVIFYAHELEDSKRTLVLFPTKEGAKAFYNRLPEHIKQEALLWPNTGGVKLFEAWMRALTHQVRVIIASPAGVFAPLSPERIIIEDEANPSYVFPYGLSISARSLAGHRAATLGAELILAGRLPSLKTYARSRPKPEVIPERRNIILADIHGSKREEIPGISGSIPLTRSLIKRTYRALSESRNVIWILNRLGESSEVFCENCGRSVTCPACGGLMRSEGDGNVLVCRRCGKIRELPAKCEHCGCDFFTGKRPGIEALSRIARKYYPDVNVYTEGSKVADMHGLVLSTHRGLKLAGRLKPAFIAWLDLDLELWKPEYGTRYNVFSALYESYWLGRKKKSDRKVLVQARSSGLRLAGMLSSGWERFLEDELRAREEYMLPPCGYIVEIECESKILRDELMNTLTDSGVFVMDPGDESMPLSLNVESLEPLLKIPELMKKNINRLIKITLRSE